MGQLTLCSPDDPRRWRRLPPSSYPLRPPRRPHLATRNQLPRLSPKSELSCGAAASQSVELLTNMGIYCETLQRVNVLFSSR
jgi:hypothetical protein